MGATATMAVPAAWDELLRHFLVRDLAAVDERLPTVECDRAALIRHGLREARGGNQRALAYYLLRGANVADFKELFPELVRLARSSNGPIERVWSAILSLPRDWVLDRIESNVDPILASNEYEDYWMFLELYERLDAGLARSLALRALAHSDPDIRERGEMTLEHIAASNRVAQQSDGTGS